MTFKELYEAREAAQSKLDDLDSSMNERVSKVIEILKSEISQPELSRILGNHLIPDWFNSISFDEDEDGSVDIYCSGTYYGARGYCEQESIRFPSEWIDLSEEDLKASIKKHVEYLHEKDREANEEKREEQAAKDYQLYLQLKSKFE